MYTLSKTPALPRNQHPHRPAWLSRGLWLLSLTGLGYLGWHLGRYGRRLWRQPLLASQVAPAGLADAPLLEARALLIASASLKAGIEKRLLPDGREKLVVCAGRRNFREPWARDFSFASFGLVELGEFEVVRNVLELFFSQQRPSGQLPVRYGSTRVLDRYLHSYFKREQPVTAPLKPRYLTGHRNIALDGNALLVIAALNYIQQSGDSDFARACWPALQRAVDWLEGSAAPDGLLIQAGFADWADSVARQGRVLYTNVVYWKAVAGLASAAAIYGTAEQAYYATKARQLQEAIQQHFWRDDLGYYVTSRVFDNLSSSGNLLAIAWGLASPAQAHAILDAMERFQMAWPIPTRVVHWAYPARFIAIENRLAGLAAYHTSAAWLWLGAWHVIALARLERLDEAQTLLDRIAQVIVQDQVVHEVYAPDGRYLSNRWYTSEAPFTWSAGMLVYANAVYRRRVQKREEGG